MYHVLNQVILCISHICFLCVAGLLIIVGKGNKDSKVSLSSDRGHAILANGHLSMPNIQFYGK